MDAPIEKGGCESAYPVHDAPVCQPKDKMEILYWAPHHQPEEKVYEAVKRTYERIHTYKDEQFYGKSYEPVEKVVTYEKNKQEDLLEPIK